MRAHRFGRKGLRLATVGSALALGAGIVACGGDDETAAGGGGGDGGHGRQGDDQPLRHAPAASDGGLLVHGRFVYCNVRGATWPSRYRSFTVRCFDP